MKKYSVHYKILQIVADEFHFIYVQYSCDADEFNYELLYRLHYGMVYYIHYT